MAVSLARVRPRFQHGPLVLDGALGTELERRGHGGTLPLWSAAALLTSPAAVETIHREYVQAGVDILVANTFRTNVRTLRAANLVGHGAALNRLAINLARRAAEAAHRPDGGEGDREAATAGAQRPVLVAASVAPVEDCYSPERVPDEQELYAEHVQMLRWVAAAGPDLVWIETMGTVREARAAAWAAAAEHLPLAVSFVVQETGDLLGGEPLEDAIGAVEPFNPLAIGLNCIPPSGVTALLPRLRRATNRPLSAYAHVDNATPIRGWSYAERASPAEYAEHVRRWLDLGATVVGGCCGTTPAHIRTVRTVVVPRT